MFCRKLKSARKGPGARRPITSGHQRPPARGIARLLCGSSVVLAAATAAAAANVTVAAASASVPVATAAGSQCPGVSGPRNPSNPLGLRELQIERAGCNGDGRRRGLASPAGGPVGLAQHEADLEARRLGQLAERLRRPPVRACEADAHGHRSGTQRRGPGCGRSSASARRRSSGVVRSIVSTPSR